MMAVKKEKRDMKPIDKREKKQWKKKRETAKPRKAEGRLEWKRLDDNETRTKGQKHEAGGVTDRWGGPPTQRVSGHP